MVACALGFTFSTCRPAPGLDDLLPFQIHPLFPLPLRVGSGSRKLSVVRCLLVLAPNPCLLKWLISALSARSAQVNVSCVLCSSLRWRHSVCHRIGRCACVGTEESQSRCGAAGGGGRYISASEIDNDANDTSVDDPAWCRK